MYAYPHREIVRRGMHGFRGGVLPPGRWLANLRDVPMPQQPPRVVELVEGDEGETGGIGSSGDGRRAHPGAERNLLAGGRTEYQLLGLGTLRGAHLKALRARVGPRRYDGDAR